MPAPAMLPPIPVDTMQAAHAAFGKGNLYLAVGDQVGALFDGIDVAVLGRSSAMPVASLMRLALATVFQYVEELPDYQAAEATRTRTDWRYALHLPMNYPGFYARNLCNFRQEQLSDSTARQVFQSLLDRLAEVGLLESGAEWPVGADDVLNLVCACSRLEALARAVQLALEGIAARHPEWLRAHALPHWYDRYSSLTHVSMRRSDRGAEAIAAEVRQDAQYLLEKVARDGLSGLQELPEVQAVGGEWLRQFGSSGWDEPVDADGAGTGFTYCAACKGAVNSVAV